MGNPPPLGMKRAGVAPLPLVQPLSFGLALEPWGEGERELAESTNGLMRGSGGSPEENKTPPTPHTGPLLPARLSARVPPCPRLLPAPGAPSVTAPMPRATVTQRTATISKRWSTLRTAR